MENKAQNTRKFISGILVGLGVGLIGSYFIFSNKTPEIPRIMISGNIVPIESLNDNVDLTDGALGKYLASRNGTKYYPTGCNSANRIKEENIIWFSTRESAENAGYDPASNCNF